MDITQRMLDTWAEEIAEAHLENKLNLDELIKIKSTEKELNIEQTRRLCEAVNTKVRQKLTYEHRNPQATFDVVDWKNIVGQNDLLQGLGDKSASLYPNDWEYFEDMMGDNEPALEKVAQKEDTNEVLALITMLKRASESASQHRVDAQMKTENAALWLDNSLRNDVIKTGSLNEAYTIAMDQIAPHNDWRPKVEDFFHSKHAYYSQTIPIALDGLDVEKIGGAINPTSKFVKQMRTYFKNYDAEEKYEKIANYLDKKSERLIAYLGGRMSDGQ